MQFNPGAFVWHVILYLEISSLVGFIMEYLLFHLNWGCIAIVFQYLYSNWFEKTKENIGKIM